MTRAFLCLTAILGLMTPGTSLGGTPSCSLSDEKLAIRAEIHVAAGETNQSQLVVALGQPQTKTTDAYGFVHWWYFRTEITRSHPKIGVNGNQWTITVWNCIPQPPREPAIVPRTAMIEITFDKNAKVSSVQYIIAN